MKVTSRCCHLEDRRDSLRSSSIHDVSITCKAIKVTKLMDRQILARLDGIIQNGENAYIRPILELGTNITVCVWSPGAVMWRLAASLGKRGKQVDQLSPPDREHMKKRLLSVLSAPIETEHLLGHSICPAVVANLDGCPWHLKTSAGRSSVWSTCMIWPLLPSHPRCWCTCKSKLVCSWVCAGD